MRLRLRDYRESLFFDPCSYVAKIRIVYPDVVQLATRVPGKHGKLLSPSFLYTETVFYENLLLRANAFIQYVIVSIIRYRQVRDLSDMCKEIIFSIEKNHTAAQYRTLIGMDARSSPPFRNSTV
jgi:hypothetical protein